MGRPLHHACCAALRMRVRRMDRHTHASCNTCAPHHEFSVVVLRARHVSLAALLCILRARPAGAVGLLRRRPCGRGLVDEPGAAGGCGRGPSSAAAGTSAWLGGSYRLPAGGGSRCGLCSSRLLQLLLAGLLDLLPLVLSVIMHALQQVKGIPVHYFGMIRAGPAAAAPVRSQRAGRRRAPLVRVQIYLLSLRVE